MAIRLAQRITLFIAVLALFACGGGSVGSGEISVRLTYPAPPEAAVFSSVFSGEPAFSDAPALQGPSAASYPISPSNRILIRVLGPGFAPIEAWFERSEGRGVINNIPAGGRISIDLPPCF